MRDVPLRCMPSTTTACDLELEDTKWIAANELAGDLDEMKLNKDLKKEFLAGYKQSDFYQAKLKNKKKNGI